MLALFQETGHRFRYSHLIVWVCFSYFRLFACVHIEHTASCVDQFLADRTGSGLASHKVIFVECFSHLQSDHKSPNHKHKCGELNLALVPSRHVKPLGQLNARFNEATHNTTLTTARSSFFHPQVIHWLRDGRRVWWSFLHSKRSSRCVNHVLCAYVF